ncbi:MAG: serine hydrolase [Bryobacteraceae bacterium]
MKPLVASLALCAVATGQTYWPTKGWREALPETQGIDSQALAQAIEQRPAGLHSLLVIRHGYVVLDSYFYPFAPGSVHDAASVTKSITSAIVGIAVDKGLIRTSQTAFPNSKIKVENLLTMTPGLECGFKPGEQELAEMKLSAHWVDYAKHLAVKYDPGVKFGYCSPGFHLLSSIVSAATHSSELEFGRKYLFDPLGIKDIVWPSDPQGITHGWGNSHFYPRDFAKLGYLYLHGGQWEGKQILSADWIKRSITHHSDPRPNVEYGYGWWLYNQQQPRSFEANGRGGQKIIVLPEKDAVIVMTGGGYDGSKITPLIFQSIKSDKPLPKNPDAYRQLQSKAKEGAQPPKPGPTGIVGVNFLYHGYKLEPNPLRLEKILLWPAEVNLTLLGTDLTVPVGLDGVYRTSPNGLLQLPLGAMGVWTTEKDFVLDLNFIANINHYTFAMKFDADRVEIVANEASGLAKNLKITGRAY